MSGLPITYNFSLDETKYKSHPNMIYKTLTDNRNGIRVTNLIPGLQSYINYLELLVKFRNKWISVGYLDLGMIPVIMGPSFMHDALVQTLLPIIKAKDFPVYAVPGTSFMLGDTMKKSTEYWAYRDDAAKFVGCNSNEVTTRMIIEELMGVKFE